MASQTVAHTHGHMLTNHRHRLHFPVAYLTENPRTHVGPMIKIRMIWQEMDSLPLQRLSCRIDGSQMFDMRAVHFCYFVAIHALLNRWNSGNTGFQSS
jgi:hypothetical protein